MSWRITVWISSMAQKALALDADPWAGEITARDTRKLGRGHQTKYTMTRDTAQRLLLEADAEYLAYKAGQTSAKRKRQYESLPTLIIAIEDALEATR